MNFILFMGLVVGTYSSVFNATPVAYDFIMWREKAKAKKLALLKEKNKLNAGLKEEGCLIWGILFFMSQA